MSSTAIPNTISSTADLKKHNCIQVYHYIYEHRQVTQASLVKALNLSAPTVSQYLNELLSHGLIEKGGLAVSNSGRRPNLFQIVKNAKISVGLEIINTKALLIISDLYGDSLYREELKINFDNSSTIYFDTICGWVNTRIKQNCKDDSKILGIGIAIQGLPTATGFTLELLQELSFPLFKIEDFSCRLNYPCSWIHDVELAAKAEIWHDPDIKNAFFISLNHELGSALIIDRAVHTGTLGFSSIVEHMCLYPNGRKCYCGKEGCVDAYCSSKALSKFACDPLDHFFSRVRLGYEHEMKIWKQYLKDLAITIDNVRMIVRSNILIGGEIESYMEDSDIRLLEEYVEEFTSFKADDLVITRGYYGLDAAAIGGSVYYIEQFINKLPIE